jgi:hypothetical protein
VLVADFDTSRLTPLELAAVLARLRTDGPDKLVRDYETLARLVAHLSPHGFTMLQIYERVMGDLWDNVTLMKRGQRIRNDTIVITRAMLIQIIEESR